MNLKIERLREKIKEAYASFDVRKYSDSISLNKYAPSILALFLVPSFVLGSIQSAESVSNENSSKPSLELVLDSHQVVRALQSKNTIVVGESATQKEARVKAETEASEKAAKDALVRNTVSRERRVYIPDPTDFNQVYLAAQNALGVDARLLKAIHIVETGASGSTLRANPSGATGPMQFLPSTFRRHGIDGNGDGIKDIGNVEDAIFSAAQYLRACGYPDMKKALWGYNPSTRYYNKVLGVMNSVTL